MSKNRTHLEYAIGRLIVMTQRAWMEEAGLPHAEETLSVTYRCHHLLQAAKAGELVDLLKGRTIAGYVGGLWLDAHQEVIPYVEAVAIAMAQAVEK
jgi:hypothetical protein